LNSDHISEFSPGLKSPAQNDKIKKRGQRRNTLQKIGGLMNRWRELLRLLREHIRTGRNQKAELSFHWREMAFLRPHFKKHLARYIGLGFLLILSSALSLPGPAITGHIIDKVFGSHNVSRLHLLVLLLLVILLISEIVRTFQEFHLLRLSQEFTFSIRINLLERILRYPLSFFREYQTGYLVSRLDEVNLLGSFFSLTILTLAESLLRFFGAIFLITRYNAKLTLIAILILPLFYEVSRRSMRAIRSTSLGMMERNAKVRGKIQETLSGIEVVKTYAKESREATEIKTGLRKIIEMEIIQNLFSFLSVRILGLITGINLLVILWVGGQEIMSGRLTVGEYVAFVAYIGFLYGPIQMFANTFLQFQRSVMAAKRISSFLASEAEDESPIRTHEFLSLRGDIRFDRVRYAYGNGKDVLHDISFSIRSGEMIAFVGRNGAGKSTLVHLILGLYMPKSGNIEIDGVDLGRVRLRTLRDRIGIVSQNIFLFDDTILNNIKYSRPDATPEDVIAAAEAAGCHDFISRFPEGYNTHVGEAGNELVPENWTGGLGAL
jgi:ABC-type bacteriocin/lantibiotic exporter with double-glycine peptidase domain